MSSAMRNTNSALSDLIEPKAKDPDQESCPRFVSATLRYRPNAGTESTNHKMIYIL